MVSHPSVCEAPWNSILGILENLSGVGPAWHRYRRTRQHVLHHIYQSFRLQSDGLHLQWRLN